MKRNVSMENVNQKIRTFLLERSELDNKMVLQKAKTVRKKDCEYGNNIVYHCYPIVK